MPDIQTTGAPEQTNAPAPAPALKKPTPRKNTKKKLVKRVIAIVVTLAVLAGICFGMWYLVFRQTEELGDIYAEPAYIGSIQSSVQGSGIATAKDNATIIVPNVGVVDQVFVAAGDTVYAGQPLYSMTSPAAVAAVETARETLNNAQQDVVRAQQGVASAEKRVGEVAKGIPAAEKELANAQNRVKQLQTELAGLRAQSGKLTITAPFAGKIIEVQPHHTGEQLTANTPIATLVNDKKLLVSFYFSYAYEDQIQVGQAAQISIPSLMYSTSAGRVEQINKVNKITPEGGTYFEAVIAFDNPGTLTEGMDATAVLTARDGAPIYPYDSGKTAYYESREITTAMDGPLTTFNLFQYLDVTAGQTLAVQGPDELNKQIEAKQEEVAQAQEAVVTAQDGVTSAHEEVETAREGITTAQDAVTAAEKTVTEAQEGLEKAQQDVESLNAVAPIDGTIASCTISAGSEVKQGDAVITISNTSSMVVTIQVDDRNIGFISLGMEIELNHWEQNYYTGRVTNISYGGGGDSGMGGMDGMGGMGGGGSSTFPVTLEVDNFDGSLYAGADLSYSFVTSQSNDCVLVATTAVKSVLDAEGNKQTVVFVQRDAPPENMLEMDSSITGVPTPEDGYYPVLVETGISDAKSVEIKSGVEDGDMVFINYTDPEQAAGGGIMYG